MILIFLSKILSTITIRGLRPLITPTIGGKRPPITPESKKHKKQKPTEERKASSSVSLEYLEKPKYSSERFLDYLDF